MAAEFKNITNIGGLLTDRPADKIPDRNLSDVYCVDFSSFGLAQTMRGPRLFANKITEVGINTRAFLYKKNFGALKKVFLRVRDNGTKSVLEWLNPWNTETEDGKWETLVDDLTTGAIMGFTPFNQSNVNQLIFCNAVENYSQWNGALTQVVSVTANTIVCLDDLAFEGFETSDTVIIDGTTYTYTGITSKTLTGVTPDPTVQAPAAGTGVAQSPDVTSLSAIGKGNVLLTASARVWKSGVLNRESELEYSKVGDATNFSADTTPDGAGIEDFPDGGGAITLLDQKDNQKIIVHKDDAILQFQLEYTSSAKIPKLDVVALADGIGATNQKAGAGNGLKSYLVSGVDGLKALARVAAGDNIDIGDSFYAGILPTLETCDFSDAAAAYFQPKQVIMVACKSSSAKQYNDQVISFFIKTNSDGSMIGDISIDYGFIADWIVDGHDLYGFSSVDQNCYKYFERNSYNGLGLKHQITSKEFTFDEPSRLKEFNTLYLEGFISANTIIKVSVIYGVMGIDDQKTKFIEWDDERYVTKQKISALGNDILGINSVGAKNANVRDSYVFCVPIHFDAKRSTRFKIKIETCYDETTVDDSYWAVSNIGFNPTLLGVDNNKIINSNE